MRQEEKGSVAINLELREIEIPIEVAEPIIAVGAESKGVFCLLSGSRAWLSGDFGVLTVPDSFRAFKAGIESAQSSLGIKPEFVARDLHPSYVSTAWAASSGLKECIVQHHHAHICGCLADNGLLEPVIGICCDGAGCGPDKASWGCEILHVTPTSFERLAHLRYFGLPGSDASAAQCWRPALSLARQAFGDEMPVGMEQVFAEVSAGDRKIVRQLLKAGVQCPQTSSMGRLFDAVAYLLDVCKANTHEAEAACKLQAAAESTKGEALAVEELPGDDGIVIDFSPALREMWKRKVEGRTSAELAADFHETVAAMLVKVAVREARRFGVRHIALSGGCFMNRLLSERVSELVEAEGITALRHKQVSCSDAGLPIGQAVIAAASIVAGN